MLPDHLNEIQETDHLPVFFICSQADEARLRKIAMSDTVSSTPPPSQQAKMHPESPLSALPPSAYLIIALILGILIGKLFL